MRSSVARRQQQLSVEELLHVRWLLGGVLALLSVWTLFYLETAIWPMAVVATVAIVATAAFPGLPATVPKFLWRLGVPGVVLFFALDISTHAIIPAFVRLNVLLVLFRAVSYRSRREDLQLVVLCLFLIIVTGVLTVSLVFAAQILFFTGAAMAFLFVVNLIHDATADEPVPPESWTLISRKRLFTRLWNVFDLRMLSLAAGLFLAVVAVSTLIFLSIPRFQMESALNFLDLNRSRSLTGFSETIALGEVTSIAQDERIAMRVDVQGTNLVPPTPYWRMVVLDDYGQGIFRVSRAVQAQVGARSIPVIDLTPTWAATAAERMELDAKSNARYTVFLEPGVSRYLPMPGLFRGLRFKELQDIVENKIFKVFATERQSAVLVSFQVEGADFSGVIPDPDFATKNFHAPQIDPKSEAWADETIRSRFLSYPATTRNVPVSVAALAFLRGVVEKITGGETLEPREFARRACSYLAEHHRYSLGAALPATPEREDPVIRWMQGDVSGHCEFFAAAFTLLGRTAGYPTRAITGFKGGTWNAYENYYMVRNSDAHAWCEVYDGAGAWFRVDPTPGSEFVLNPTKAVAMGALTADHSFSAYFDSLRMIWYRRIVNFDERSQKQVVGTLRGMGDMLGIWTRATVDTVTGDFKSWMNSPWTFQNKGDQLFIAITVLLTAVVLRRLGIGTSDVFEWFRKGERPTRRRAGDLLRRLQKKLSDPRPRIQDRELAHEIEGQLLLIRFGRMEHWPEPLRVFRATRRMLSRVASRKSVSTPGPSF